MPSNLNKIDINVLVNELARNNEDVYESEAQFQFDLAWLINEKYKDLIVKLELVTATTYVNNKLKRIYTDIVVLDNDGEFIAIELKYKTKASEYNGVKLLNHGATDLGRFDYLWDIHRLELLKEKSCKNYEFNEKLKKCVKCFAILLTNESKYWRTCENGNNSLYKNFCISEQDEIIKNKKLTWHKKNNKSCIDNTWRDVTLKFENDYRFKWHNFNHDFKYVITEI